MKKFTAKYMLYIYLNFIKDEDMEIYENWALPIIKVTNFVRGVYIWMASVIFFPIFIIGMIFDKNMNKLLKNNKYIL